MRNSRSVEPQVASGTSGAGCEFLVASLLYELDEPIGGEASGNVFGAVFELTKFPPSFGKALAGREPNTPSTFALPSP